MEYKMKKYKNRNSWNNMMHQGYLLFKTKKNKVSKSFCNNNRTILYRNSQNKKKILNYSNQIMKTYLHHKINKIIINNHKQRLIPLSIKNILSFQSLYINKNKVKSYKKIK